MSEMRLNRNSSILRQKHSKKIPKLNLAALLHYCREKDLEQIPNLSASIHRFAPNLF